jgi:hypothetical protein
MKPTTGKFILAMLVAITIASSASAQCVIYICPETNVFGYAWSNNSYEHPTINDLSEIAEQKCIESGGTACRLWKTYEKTGWYGIIRYKDSDGHSHLSTSQANAEQNEAEEDLNAILKEQKAVETTYRKTFRVYNNH